MAVQTWQAAVVIVLLVAVGIAVAGVTQVTGAATAGSAPVKIGIITDLTGPAAYWGESTQIGAQIAERELAGEGKPVKLLFEDYKLEPKEAVTAARKLVSVDGVDALYVEFNPATVPVAAAVKDAGIPYVLDSAAVSVVNTSNLAFKTYYDYEASCKAVAERFKQDGIAKISVLKPNIEFGERCANGVKAIYPDAIIEPYNVGEPEVRTQMLKLSAAGAGAVVHGGFEPETLSALKTIRENGLAIKYATLDDFTSSPAFRQYAPELEGGYIFGFRPVTPDFKAKVDAYGKKLSTYNGAALAYIHVKQLARAIYECDREPACVSRQLSQSPPDATIGFQKFEGRIARFEMQVTPGSQLAG